MKFNSICWIALSLILPMNSCASSQSAPKPVAASETQLYAGKIQKNLQNTSQTSDNADENNAAPSPLSSNTSPSPVAPDILQNTSQTSDNADENNAATSPLSATSPASSDASDALSNADFSTEQSSTNSGEQSSENASTSASTSPDNPLPEELTPAQKLASHGDFANARKMLLEDLRKGNSHQFEEFWAFVDEDPTLSQTLDDEVKPHGSNTISALGGGSTVSFKYKDSADEAAKAALKPDQDLRQTMYRSEIAFFRLCQILECSFAVPVTRPARWTKSDFITLYNASDSKKNYGYKSKFEHLLYAVEDGKTYLYAAYKEWIPDFIGFPIEVESAWTLYERPGTTNYPDLNSFFNRILEKGRDNAPSTRKYITYANALSTRDILRQLSDLTLIDFLTNNWDRYSGAQDNYGANCHFHPGGIIAIDNGASFPAWHAPRVVKRLHRIQTFSRDLVQNLRMLDPDDLLTRLIPNPTREELKSGDRFKERRLEALNYIDDLISRFGEDNILIY